MFIFLDAVIEFSKVIVVLRDQLELSKIGVHYFSWKKIKKKKRMSLSDGRVEFIELNRHSGHANKETFEVYESSTM